MTREYPIDEEESYNFVGLRSKMYNMRRLIIVCLILCGSIQGGSAQIHKSFLGFTLGVTDREQILQKYPDAKGNWIGDMDVALCPGSSIDGVRSYGGRSLHIDDVTFAGIHWEHISFLFYLDKLCEICFESCVNSSGENPMVEDNYFSLKNSISKKYGRYLKDCQRVSSEECFYIYSDGVTRMILGSVGTNDNISYYTLRYQNISLFAKKFSKKIDANEL